MSEPTNETQAWTTERLAAIKAQYAELTFADIENREYVQQIAILTTHHLLPMVDEIERLLARPTTAQLQAALDERDAARAEVMQLRARLAAAERVVDTARRFVDVDRRHRAGAGVAIAWEALMLELSADVKTYDTVRAALAEAGR